VSDVDWQVTEDLEEFGAAAHDFLLSDPVRFTLPLTVFHQLSHGEGFLEILRTRVNQVGFYLMDEPDAPLSFTASLGLAALLHDLVVAGSQLVVATHSPIVAALPGASILELGDWGFRPTVWEELYLVGAWRRFMTEPASYFRHLLADETG